MGGASGLMVHINRRKKLPPLLCHLQIRDKLNTSLCSKLRIDEMLPPQLPCTLSPSENCKK